MALTPPPGNPGRLVRPYALTGGRTRPTNVDLAIEALVRAHPEGWPHPLSRHEQLLVDHAAQPLSVAELAAHCSLPIGVVRVLAGDLVFNGPLVVVAHGLGHGDAPAATDINLLERVLNGLRTL
jgi:hypothetical protein